MGGSVLRRDELIKSGIKIAKFFESEQKDLPGIEGVLLKCKRGV